MAFALPLGVANSTGAQKKTAGTAFSGTWSMLHILAVGSFHHLVKKVQN